jgi:hypothetical protein
MNLFPFENIVISSPLSENEIKNSLKNNIEWNTELGMTFNKNSIRDYEGFVQGGKFKIRRILKSGINSFIPIVTGDVVEKVNGSQIELKFRLHKSVAILAIIFTIFSGSIFITTLFSKPNEQLVELMNDKIVKETLSAEQYKELVNNVIPKGTDWNGLILFIAPYLMCTLFFNFFAVFHILIHANVYLCLVRIYKEQNSQLRT